MVTTFMKSTTVPSLKLSNGAKMSKTHSPSPPFKRALNAGTDFTNMAVVESGRSVVRVRKGLVPSWSNTLTMYVLRLAISGRRDPVAGELLAPAAVAAVAGRELHLAGQGVGDRGVDGGGRVQAGVGAVDLVAADGH